jgi:hypothetical protein
MIPDPGNAAHEVSLAVWDVTSPVVAGRRVTLKVGVACSNGCNLAGAIIDVYTYAEARLGGGTLGPAPAPGTAALYWTELDVAAPAVESAHSWTLRATVPDDVHGQASSSFSCVVVRPPEHRVTITVVEKDSRAPLDGVELRLGMFRATTNDAGVAAMDVCGATYEVTAWKLGHDILSSSLLVAGDLTVELEMAATVTPEQPYWM